MPDRKFTVSNTSWRSEAGLPAAPPRVRRWGNAAARTFHPPMQENTNSPSARRRKEKGAKSCLIVNADFLSTKLRPTFALLGSLS